MDHTQRPIANPIVVLREEFDDWAVLFDPDTAAALGVNPVGVAIWKKMDGRRSLAEIVSQVTLDFDDVPAVAREEISAFVDELAERGFVGHELKDDERSPDD